MSISLYNNWRRYKNKNYFYNSTKPDEEDDEKLELLLNDDENEIDGTLDLNLNLEYSRLTNIKRYLVDPYVYSRLICEKYLYNFGSNNDISQINDFLFIGNYSTSTNRDLLKERGITHIVTSLSCFNPAYPDDFTYKHIMAYDDLNEDMTINFLASNSFIREAHQAGGKVYIHCMCGVSRSVTLAIAYLLFLRQVKYDNMDQLKVIEQKLQERGDMLNNDTYKKLISTNRSYLQLNSDLIYELVKIKENRPVAGPNKAFLLQLNKYYIQSY